jgi:ATP-binding cassette, subfamily B, bacterial
MAFFAMKDLRQLARSFWLALRTVRAAGLGPLTAVAVTTLLTGLVPLALSVAMANIVGAAAGVAVHGIESAAGDRLRAAAIAYVVLLALQGVVSSAVLTMTTWIRRQLDGRLRERVMAVTLRPAGLRHFEDPEMKPVVEAARNSAPGTGMSPGAIAAVLPSSLGYRVTILARIIGLTYLSWPLGLAYLVIVAKSQDEMQQAIWRVAGGGGGTPPAPVAYQLDLAMGAAAGKDVRVFGLGGWIADRFRTGMLGHIGGVWATRRDFTPALVVTLAAMVVLNVVALAYFADAAINGRLGAGELAFAISTIIALSPAFNQDDMPLAFATTTIETIESAERLVASPDVSIGGSNLATGMPLQTVRFSGVRFTYPNGDHEVLQGLDLELRAGERLALVGLNGAGKTTLVKLLCGMYEPTAGSIVLDDEVDVTDLDPASWRSKLAVLFQDFVHYELSAEENVRFGAVRWSAVDPQRELVAAATDAGYPT